ncbi:MAG: tRNA uridine-5-carboxymethylaminomethyl(34) synthesis GTPase MnmE [Lachnospiraceae bacterium]|nr:tRNA uridine-5-carboxymethylaminomethyl(34) synthesis GTPase MnmE [Lachnospiraceae bacterium]
METDTIAAIATALSDSGIGIIRISGNDAVNIADSVFVNKNGNKILKSVKSHTIHYGFIVDFENIKDEECFEDKWKDYIIDEVMISVMKAPNSYTRENVVEINCHGGVLLLQKILEIILNSGARMAEPGEFTKRAFLNGRIDLSRAEAVMEVIHSQNEFALASSVNQLKGKLSDKIKKIRADIIYEIAFIEAALDDPEHMSLEGYPEKLNIKLDIMLEEIKKLLDTSDDGRIIKEGISTVILGKPNAGKSSLLNILVGEEKAIVTDIAGTTRDILEEHVRLHGINLNIIDTAGIRNTEDTVEKIGVEKAIKYASDADLIIYVVDASVGIDDNDRNIISLIKDKNVIILLNKSDIDNVVSREDVEILLENNFSEQEYKKNISIIRTSTKDIFTNEGIDEFEKVIQNMFFKGRIKNNNEIIITNMRHKEALKNAYESLNMVKKSIDDGMQEDFYSIDLMSAYSELGRIIGEEVDEDVVEEIFSKFCMGK